jgi:hypothetical protein
VLEKHRDTDSDTESATSTAAVAAKSEELALPIKSEITGLTFCEICFGSPLEIRGDKSLDRPIGDVDLVLRCASHTSCSWGELTLTYVSCRESFSTCVKQCCERVVDRASINSWADDA